MHKAVVAIAALALLVLAAPMLDGARTESVRAAGDTFDVDNETVTVDTSDPSALDGRGAAVFTGNATVRNATTDATIAESGNWTYHPENGTIAFVDGGHFSTGDTANVTYDMAEPTDAQRVTTEVGSLGIRTGEALALALVAGLVMTLLVFVGRKA